MRVSFVIVLFFGFVNGVLATPNIQTWTTSNGARVLFVEAHELPMLDVRVVFDAGAARDAGSPGVALMTNGMMSEGAGAWNANELASRFEGVGASFSNSSHRDMSVFSIRSLIDKAWLDQAIDTFATILQKPTFPKEAFDREIKRLLVALEQKKQSPGAISSENMYKAIFGDHPYASLPEGTPESAKKLRTEALAAFYKKYMVGKNAVVVMVGDLSTAQAKKISEQVVGALPAGAKAPRLPGVKALTKAEMIKIDFPSSQTKILLAQPGIQRGDPDYFPLYVGNHVLGGSGLVSILNDEIREKRGLSYSSYSYFSPMRVAGPFIVGLGTKNESSSEALQIMRQTLRQFVAEGATEAQLTAAKQNLTGGFALQLASNKKIVDNLSAIGFYALPLDYLDQYINNVEAVTLAQVKDAFQRRIHPDKMVTVMVGGEQTEDASQEVSTN